RRRSGTWLQHHDQQRPLLPLRMRNRDGRRLRHRGMRDREVLQLDGADPLAARLDHVLGAIGDLHVAQRTNGRDIAGVEPAALVEHVVTAALVVTGSDPWPANLQRPERLAIARDFDAVVVLHSQLDAEYGSSLASTQSFALLLAQSARFR